ncbi:MAG TPA: T9SS type A sorting domain-containing protein [Flavobacterium sp.]|nr:T9SS type A sorting domain-containing protein [Flavobacterium sp.]
MKKITFLLLLLPFLCFSQNPDWQWARNHSIATNTGRQYTAIDSEGNIYLVGDFAGATLTIGSTTLTNSGADFWDIYIAKYDKDGNVLWAKKLGGEYRDSPCAIATDGSGNFYITGSYQHSITIGSTTLDNTIGVDFSNNFFAKFDSDGNALWAKSNASNLGNWFANSIKTDALGNVYLAGLYSAQTLTFDTNTITNENYIDQNYKQSWVGKFDSNGKNTWLRSSQSNTQNTWGSTAFNIAVDTVGNVYIAGEFNNSIINFGAVTFTKTAIYDYNANMYLVKYNADGVAQWGKNTGTIYENITWASSVVTDSGNNVFVSGFFSNDIHFDAITLTADGGSKPFTAKFDTNGTALWAKTQTGSNCAAMSQNADVDSAGNLYIVGYMSCSSMNFGNGVTLAVTGEGALYIAKYNAAGNAVWARRSSATNINNQASIAVKNANEIYVAGTFWSPTLTFGTTPTLTKTTSNYDLFIAKLFYQPLARQDFNADSFSVSPNPVNNTLFVKDLPGSCKYSLYDTTGKQVLQGVLEGTNAALETSGLNAGMYLLRLQNENGAYAVKKIVKL